MGKNKYWVGVKAHLTGPIVPRFDDQEEQEKMVGQNESTFMRKADILAEAHKEENQ